MSVILGLGCLYFPQDRTNLSTVPWTCCSSLTMWQINSCKWNWKGDCQIYFLYADWFGQEWDYENDLTHVKKFVVLSQNTNWKEYKI